MSLTLWLASRNLFFTQGCLAQPSYMGRYLVLLKLDISGFIDTHGRPVPLSTEAEGVDGEVKNGRRRGGEETAVGMQNKLI